MVRDYILNFKHCIFLCNTTANTIIIDSIYFNEIQGNREVDDLHNHIDPAMMNLHRIAEHF